MRNKDNETKTRTTVYLPEDILIIAQFYAKKVKKMSLSQFIEELLRENVDADKTRELFLTASEVRHDQNVPTVDLITGK